MKTKDKLKEMLVSNAASWSKKEGDDMAEIYVDDFLNELLSKFKLLPIHVINKRFLFEGRFLTDSQPFKKVIDAKDIESAIADMETNYYHLKWMRFTEI